MTPDQPITERRWFTRIWSYGEPLSNTRYVVLLIGAPVLALWAALLILDGTWWWLGVLYLVLPINFGAQAYCERQRRARERATRLLNTHPATPTNERRGCGP